MSEAGNISWDGTPVQIRMNSSAVVCMDPLQLDCIRNELAALPADARRDLDSVLALLNGNHYVMSHYEIADFKPGMYTLDPRDIRKFGDEDDDCDYEEAEEAEDGPVAGPISYPFVATDSAAIVLVDFAHLSELLELFTGEQYDLALRGEEVFGRITDALGGPYFAFILAGCMPDMQFDGDGLYMIKPGAVMPCQV